MGIALLLHVLAATVWVGGMFFAYVCLRPVAAATLDAPHRLRLWADTLARFFPWVGLASALLLVTGFFMIFAVMGGIAAARPHVHAMMGLGIVMMLIAAHVWFAPLRRLRVAVAGGHWTDGGKALGQVRLLVAINLALGLLVVAIGSGGRYFFH